MLSPMPTELQAISSVLLRDKVYISGIATDKVNVSRQVQVYSRETKWSTLPHAPNYNAPITVIDGHITLIGGRDAKTHHITNILSTWIEKKDQWEQILPSMPTSRLESGVCHHDGLLLVTGGIVLDAENVVTVVNTVHVYNFSTKLWSTPDALELPIGLRSHHIVVSEENTLLVVHLGILPHLKKGKSNSTPRHGKHNGGMSKRLSVRLKLLSNRMDPHVKLQTGSTVS